MSSFCPGNKQPPQALWLSPIHCSLTLCVGSNRLAVAILFPGHRTSLTGDIHFSHKGKTVSWWWKPLQTPGAAAPSVPPHPTGQNAMWPRPTLTKPDDSPSPEMVGVLRVTGRKELQSCPGKAREQSLEMPSKASQDSELVLGGREGGRRQSSRGQAPRAERMKVPLGWPH